MTDSWQQIVVTTPKGEETPSLERFIATLNIHLSGFVSDLGEEYEIPDHTDDDRGCVLSFGWHEKYQTEGSYEAAEALAKRFPASEVYLEHEWTGEEPEVQKWMWEGGVVSQTFGGAWSQVEADKPTPAVGAHVYVALAEWGKDDGDESPIVRVALTPGTAKLCLIIALWEIWQQAPNLFHDDGPEWMREHPFVDGTLVADVDIDAWWDGFHDATTAPFTSIIEQEVQL